MEKMVEGTRSLLKDVILSNPPWALDEDPMKQGSSPAKVCQLHSCADEAYKGGQWVTIDSSRGGRTASKPKGAAAKGASPSANLPQPSPLMFWGRCLWVDFEGICNPKWKERRWVLLKIPRCCGNQEFKVINLTNLVAIAAKS